ncbi:unnamed protein product [Chrysodeixis includens]|uniref:Uncharacterized protein n=1 Tax=Chrysodeixis includens TaxID=689277 RepID=A0A9N8PZ00_CHRIL|nr:unnamed protein product [Chrysodeixis includens]
MKEVTRQNSKQQLIIKRCIYDASIFRAPFWRPGNVPGDLCTSVGRWAGWTGPNTTGHRSLGAEKLEPTSHHHLPNFCILKQLQQISRTHLLNVALVCSLPCTILIHSSLHSPT